MQYSGAIAGYTIMTCWKFIKLLFLLAFDLFIGISINMSKSLNQFNAMGTNDAEIKCSTESRLKLYTILLLLSDQ